MNIKQRKQNFFNKRLSKHVQNSLKFLNSGRQFLELCNLFKGSWNQNQESEMELTHHYYSSFIRQLKTQVLLYN